MTSIDWDFEIKVLRDLYYTVPNSHVVAAHAFLREMGRVEQEPDGRLLQQLLEAKLAAELMSSLEDLGALIWAVRSRYTDGILGAYLRYQQTNASDVYTRINEGEALAGVLDLPTDLAEGGAGGRTLFDVLNLSGIEDNARVGASLYCGRLIGTRGRTGVLRFMSVYNKVKHGFVVIERPDRIAEDIREIAGWDKAVNVVVRKESERTLRLAQIEMSTEFIDRLKVGIEMTAECWRAICSWVVFANECQYPLDQRLPPTTPAQA